MTPDRHVYACALARAATEDRPMAVALGLAPEALAALIHRHFPDATDLIRTPMGDGSAPLSLEEPDLRALLIEHASCGGSDDARWLAHIVARRSLGGNHLWQDLGLTSRADLNDLLNRHFAPLARRNERDMKWKKFFYRELCRREGIPVCRAPNCAECVDFAHCHAPEDGEPLSILALSQTRQLSVPRQAAEAQAASLSLASASA